MEPPSSIDPLPVVSSLATTYIVGFSILALLLLTSAFLAGAEAAYVSMTPNDVERLKKGKGKLSAAALSLLKAPEYLFTTIQQLGMFVSVLLVLLSAYLFYPLIVTLQSNVELLLVAAIAGAILLLLGSALPKVIAVHTKFSFVCITAYPLLFLTTIMRPLAMVPVKITAWIDGKFGKRAKSDLSIGDLSDAIAMTHDPSAEDKKLLKSIVNFVSTDVKEVMRPRIDISAVSIDTGFRELYKFIVDCGYSRIPVYKGDLDDIQGVLYIKDLLPYLENTNGNFKWEELIRPAYFVPESKLTNDLLKEFQQKRIHMAIVVDEYGVTSGIITFEDILEEIVGEILDETDVMEEEEKSVKQKDGSYIFDGKVTLPDFCRTLGIDKEIFSDMTDDVETLGGLILNLKGGLPEVGEEFSFDRFRMVVLGVDSRRITSVNVLLRKNDE